MEYRKIILKGKFLHDKEVYIGPRSLISDGSGASNDSGPKAGGFLSGGLMTSSPSGYFVITPFKLANSK
jgi:surfeit locus 1 family protein